MTGNSLDAVDTVLTRFNDSGKIEDLAFHTEPFPHDLRKDIRILKKVCADPNFIMSAVDSHFSANSGGRALDAVHHYYISTVAEAVRKLIEHAKRIGALGPNVQPDAIGLHGQTVAHTPPSIVRHQSRTSSTMQFGDGQELADLTGIPVIYDFRSDDIMKNGEGAPLAPVHHLHLAMATRTRGIFPLLFLNGGNTSNISIVSTRSGDTETCVLGWDCGPFNHLTDLLMQSRGETCDWNGKIGAAGRVHSGLLEQLFRKSVLLPSGVNFLELDPPRSSDPQWYQLLPELAGTAALNGEHVSFEDRVRTAEYFAAYCVVHGLTKAPSNIETPHYFALCGGGWNNPIVVEHFSKLIRGEWNDQPILDGHRTIFEQLRSRFGSSPITIAPSDDLGFQSAAMEARLFADAAWCRIRGLPFTTPATTRVDTPCICGVARFPITGGHVTTWKDSYDVQLTRECKAGADRRFGRAVPGWST